MTRQELAETEASRARAVPPLPPLPPPVAVYVGILAPMLVCLLLPVFVGFDGVISLAEVASAREGMFSTAPYQRALVWQVVAFAALSGVMAAAWRARVALIPLVFLILAPISSCGAVGAYRVKVGNSFAQEPVAVTANEAARLSSTLPVYVEVSGWGCAQSAAQRTVVTNSKSGKGARIERRTPIATDCGALQEKNAQALVILEVFLKTEGEGVWRGVLYPVALAGLTDYPKVPYQVSPQALFLAEETPRGWWMEGALGMVGGLALPLLILTILLFTDLRPGRMRGLQQQQQQQAAGRGAPPDVGSSPRPEG